MKTLRLLPLLGAALLAACPGLTGSDPADVRYEADRAAYAPSDEIVTRLVNESDAVVGYNLCGARLEKRAGSGWIAVARNPEHPCTMPLYSLQPGETATYREPAGVFPGAGTYRLRTTVETPVPGRRGEVVTNPFTVQ